MAWPYSVQTGKKLQTALRQFQQRTGGSGGLRSDAERIAFQNAVKQDIANISDQLNSVYYQLVKNLAQEPNLNALNYGITGNVIFTDINAQDGQSGVFWDSVNQRGKTLKESIDTLITQISLVSAASTVTIPEFDDSELQSDIENLGFDIQQIVEDGFGGDYTLNGSGSSELVFSLAQHINALGAFFAGFPGLGIDFTSSATYPGLAINTAADRVFIFDPDGTDDPAGGIFTDFADLYASFDAVDDGPRTIYFKKKGAGTTTIPSGTYSFRGATWIGDQTSGTNIAVANGASVDTFGCPLRIVGLDIDFKGNTPFCFLDEAFSQRLILDMTDLRSSGAQAPFGVGDGSEAAFAIELMAGSALHIPTGAAAAIFQLVGTNAGASSITLYPNSFLEEDGITADVNSEWRIILAGGTYELLSGTPYTLISNLSLGLSQAAGTSDQPACGVWISAVFGSGAATSNHALPRRPNGWKMVDAYIISGGGTGGSFKITGVGDVTNAMVPGNAGGITRTTQMANNTFASEESYSTVTTGGNPGGTYYIRIEGL